MWRRANLRRLIAACKRHPRAGLAGFLVGLLFGVTMSFLARLGGRPAAAPRDFFTLLHIGPALGALLCLAILVWVAGTLRLPAKPGPVFLVCLFPGMMLGPLLVVIAGALTRTLA